MAKHRAGDRRIMSISIPEGMRMSTSSLTVTVWDVTMNAKIQP